MTPWFLKPREKAYCNSTVSVPIESQFFRIDSYFDNIPACPFSNRESDPSRRCYGAGVMKRCRQRRSASLCRTLTMLVGRGRVSAQLSAASGLTLALAPIQTAPSLA